MRGAPNFRFDSDWVVRNVALKSCQPLGRPREVNHNAALLVRLNDSFGCRFEWIISEKIREFLSVCTETGYLAPHEIKVKRHVFLSLEKSVDVKTSSFSTLSSRRSLRATTKTPSL